MQSTGNDPCSIINKEVFYDNITLLGHDLLVDFRSEQCVRMEENVYMQTLLLR